MIGDERVFFDAWNGIDERPQIARLRDGRRCLLEISELRGVDEGGHYQLAQVFRTDVRPLGTGCQVHFGPIQVEDLGRRMRDKLERQGIRWTC